MNRQNVMDNEEHFDKSSLKKVVKLFNTVLPRMVFVSVHCTKATHYTNQNIKVTEQEHSKAATK